MSTYKASQFAHGRVNTRAQGCIGICDEEQPSKVLRLVPARSAVRSQEIEVTSAFNPRTMLCERTSNLSVSCFLPPLKLNIDFVVFAVGYYNLQIIKK